jgi:riboflavin synthase
MFTGIITHIGTLIKFDRDDSGARLRVGIDADITDLSIGASIAHDGCCLTVITKSIDSFEVFAANETLNVTTLKHYKVGHKINLERALRLGDELGGHLVSGHVDSTATVISLTKDGAAWRIVFEVQSPFHRFIAPKGSVALAGISLTINEVNNMQFGVSIIGHTWDSTTISSLKVGDSINLEVDRLARYAARYSETQ